MSKKYGTYMIEFIDGSAIITGNNYKPWWQHAVDYFYRVYRSESSDKVWIHSRVQDIIKSVKFSNQTYYDDGGLKWCPPDEYQGVIDEVVERDKLVPLKFEDIVFANSPTDKSLLKKKFERL